MQPTSTLEFTKKMRGFLGKDTMENILRGLRDKTD